MDAYREKLAAGCSDLGIEISDAQLNQLLAYLDLLQKWNRTYNLTAIRDPEVMITRHLLDSLAVAPLIRGRLFIDVGTGGGLPGVPLSIVFPKRNFHLLDSNGKKTRFLFQVKTDLGLANIKVHHNRVERFVPEALFDGVLSRAFASLADMINNCAHLLAPGGRFLAMKAVLEPGELAAVTSLCRVEQAHSLAVPGLNEQRHLLEMSQAGSAS